MAGLRMTREAYEIRSAIHAVAVRDAGALARGADGDRTQCVVVDPCGGAGVSSRVRAAVPPCVAVGAGAALHLVLSQRTVAGCGNRDLQLAADLPGNRAMVFASVFLRHGGAGADRNRLHGGNPSRWFEC